MKWLESFTFVMRSSITALREKVEDPERMLHQLIVDMEEELETVRQSVAGAIADEIQMEKRVAQAHSESESWMERAASALKRGDERGSKAAIEQKVQAEQRAKSLDDELHKQREQTSKLRSAFADLEHKIRQARQKRTLLLARLARAESTQRINSALDRSESTSAFAQFSRLEQRVERSEAMSEAYDRLEGRDPDAEELAAQFAREERQEQIDIEFEELKRRVAPQA